MRHATRLIGWLVLVLTLSVAGSAAAQTEEELEQARATFAEGVELTRQQRWTEAAQRFREVMRVRATAQVRYNLGLALYHSGQRAESRRLLRAALADESLPPDSRREARRLLALMDEERQGRRTGGGSARAGGGPTDGGGSAAGDRQRDGTDDGDGDGDGDGAGDDAGEGGGEGSDGSLIFEQPFTGSRAIQLEVHAGFSFFGFGLATGARLGIPLIHNGFVESINNALYLTFGIDFYFVQQERTATGNTYGPGLGVPVTLQWQLHFTDRFSAFAELGGQFFMHPRIFDRGDFDQYTREPGYWVVFAVGGSYRLSDNFLLTLRLGTPYSSLGLTIEF